MVVSGTQDWVVSKLKPNRRQLWDVPEAALATYNSIDPAIRLPWNPRTVANVINSFVLDEARKAFSGNGGSRFLEINNTAYHLMNGCALWYKQLGDDGLPSNYPTESALELMQGSFPFAPKYLLLVVGFKFDPMLHRLEKVEIQRFNGLGQMQFHIELQKLASPARVIAMPPGKIPAKPKTRVAIKLGPEQKNIIVGE